MKEFAQDVASGLRKRQDCVMAITGRERKGKSTFSVRFGLALSEELGKQFLIKQNVVYGKRGGLEKIEDKAVNPIIDDEGTDNFNKVDRWELWQKDLMKIFTKAGMYYKAYLICLPNFFDFTKYWREWRFRYWVWIPFRGKAIVLGPSENPFSLDPWNRRDNEKSIYKVYQGAGDSLDSLLDGIRNSRNYHCEIDFEDLEPTLKAEYEEYSEAHKKIRDEGKEEKEELSRQQVAFGRAIHLLRAYPREFQWTWGELEEFLGIPHTTLTAIFEKEKPPTVPQITNTKRFSVFARKLGENPSNLTKLLFSKEDLDKATELKEHNAPAKTGPPFKLEQENTIDGKESNLQNLQEDAWTEPAQETSNPVIPTQPPKLFEETK